MWMRMTRESSLWLWLKWRQRKARVTCEQLEESMSRVECTGVVACAGSRSTGESRTRTRRRMCDGDGCLWTWRRMEWTGLGRGRGGLAG